MKNEPYDTIFNAMYRQVIHRNVFVTAYRNYHDGSIGFTSPSISKEWRVADERGIFKIGPYPGKKLYRINVYPKQVNK